MTAGGWVARLIGTLPSPIACSSSFWTIFKNTCPGVRLLLTSAPSACSLTRLTNSRTTGSATSASSKAIRTSRKVSLILSSVRRPRPVIFFNDCDNRSLKFSNMRICSLLVADVNYYGYGGEYTVIQPKFPDPIGFVCNNAYTYTWLQLCNIIR